MQAQDEGDRASSRQDSAQSWRALQLAHESSQRRRAWRTGATSDYGDGGGGKQESGSRKLKM